MHARPLLRFVGNLAVPLLSVFACYAGTEAYAAESGRAKQSPSGMSHFVMPAADASIKLAFLNSALAGEDDCEEDSLLAQADTPNDMQLLTLNTHGQTSIAGRASSASPAPATAAKPPEPPPLPTWDILPSDRTLNAALARWAAKAGWQLVWEVPVDYAVQARTTVPGTFEQAIEAVTKSMATAEIPLKAIFYEGNKVLRIVAKGTE